jgi:hypothetical protein
LDVNIRPFGPEKPERVIIATTDPVSLPDLTTFYLVTNLPAPGSEWAQKSELAVASLEEVVRLYGLRMGVEQSRHPGQVRPGVVGVPGQKRPRHPKALAVSLLRLLPSRGIIRPILLWQNHTLLRTSKQQRLSQSRKRPGLMPSLGGRKEPAQAAPPQLTWPQALRAVRAWLEPWVLLRRFWQAWSALPPPHPLQQLLEYLSQGFPLYLYATF